MGLPKRSKFVQLYSYEYSIIETRHDSYLCSFLDTPETTFKYYTMDHLFNGAARDAHYNGNMAQYLVDLHDSKATFDFCGGMLFQFVLSVKLRQNLIATSKMDTKDCTATQPVIYDAGVNRMAKMPNYGKSASADDVTLFHGREIRKVRTQAAHTSISSS